MGLSRFHHVFSPFLKLLGSRFWTKSYLKIQSLGLEYNSIYLAIMQAKMQLPMARPRFSTRLGRHSNLIVRAAATMEAQKTQVVVKRGDVAGATMASKFAATRMRSSHPLMHAPLLPS